MKHMPDLLDALKKYMEQTHTRAMLSVITCEDDELLWRDHVTPLEMEAYDDAEAAIAKAEGATA